MDTMIPLHILDDNNSRRDNFYNMFRESTVMIDQLFYEAKIHQIFMESECIDHNNTEGLNQILEGVGESIKNGITKLWNAIVKMVNKFFDRANELFNDGKNFLENNKAVILNKKPVQNVPITVYKYDLQRFYDVTVAVSSSKDIIDIEDKDAALKKVCAKAFANTPGDNESVSDFINKYVRGEKEVTIQSQSLNMTTMYNYCVGFTDLKKEIKADIKKLDAIEKEVETYISSLYDKAKSAEEEQKSAQTDNKSEEDNTKSSTTGRLVDGKTIDQRIDEKLKPDEESVFILPQSIDLLTEVDIGKPPAQTTGSGATSNSATTTSSANANMNIKTGDYSKSDAQGAVDTSKEIARIQKSIQLYYKAAGDVLGAKLTLAVGIFKDYMQILRWHVGNFTPKEKKHTDMNAKKGAEYTNKSKEKAVEREELSDDSE